MISGCDILHARLLFLYCNENYFNFAILKNKLYLSPSVGKKLEIERRKQINKWLLTCDKVGAIICPDNIFFYAKHVGVRLT